jgi:hypothetical protein
VAVGCFPIVCPAATLPIEREAARGLLSCPWPLLLSPMERGASTLESVTSNLKNRWVFLAVAVRIFFPLKEESCFRSWGCCCLRWERGASTLEERKPFRWERREALFIVWSLLLSVIGVKPKLYLFFLFFDFVSCYYSQRVLISIKGLV